MTTKRPELGDWAGVDELRALQQRRLPALLARAAASPFYRRRHAGRALPATVEDFRALEPTGKQDLRDAYPYGLLAVAKEELATYHESSGTAGQPTASYYTEQDWADLAERYARKWVGITAGDTFLVRTPYALMITGHLAHAAARSHGATVVPADSRSAATPPARLVRVLHDLEVTLTWSNPTETLLWSAAARAAGLDPGKDFPWLRALFVGGEPLSPARRARISEIWNVPVVEEYGSTETGTLAGQCPEGRLHLWADRALFEVFDPATGAITEEGRGRLVVTPLYREAMPLLRYNLDDDVEISYASCRCDWQLPVVTVFGRSGFGHPVGGGSVDQHRLEELVFQLPVEDQVVFWRARADRDLLRVQMEVPAERREGATARLAASIGAELGVPCEVEGLEPGTLVPLAALTSDPDVLKPRGLFGPDEDWDRALLYY
ncbi:putative coenzyme F390 synthetase [Actinacidiphila reveromycinica]|uniref:Putative coenzyme F390 synthetase n=1 Tax=Actinacidiphila reveromycinica TaxID=659352 RepID=A0A7U3UWL7_9ACTN|nr:AMP-binding protein [Streptomyces sp. SN-593]BBB00121.1 putative coenzyme F390 synthetase [Streptomyces sp. SN-593]